MATQPPPGLPIFYNNLQPLSSQEHGKYRSQPSDTAPYFANVHAVPLTVDEFIHAQRHYPIVFSAGDNPVPLALFGLNEGVNVFVDDEGKPFAPFYVPAYVRRYPYMLARLRPDAQELSLCFDPTSDLIGEGGDGELLFDGDKPAEQLNNILKFCEDFEISAQRTNAFMEEVKALDLMIEGEVAIQPEGSDQPYIYRGFQMISEEKFRDLHGDQLRKINQNGVLPLLLAHIFSLSLVRDIFGRQMQLGKVPPQVPLAAPVNA